MHGCSAAWHTLRVAAMPPTCRSWSVRAAALLLECTDLVNHNSLAQPN
jgi:hypothetical protein